MGPAGGSDGGDTTPTTTTKAEVATTTTEAPTTTVPDAASDSDDPIKLPIHNWSSQIAGVYAVGAMLESTGNTVEYISAASSLPNVGQAMPAKQTNMI